MSIRRERPPRSQACNWQKELVALHNELKMGKLDRRRFVAGVLTLLTLAATPQVAFADIKGRAIRTKIISGGSTDFPEDPWLTFASVQNHLLPDNDDGPGANDINATLYLQGVLVETDIDKDDKEFILNGVGWLNDVANKQEHATFAELSEEQRERVLREVEKTRAGERWISLILLYILEALLCDPVYGGNSGGIGWKWLQHQPGFPRPPADKTYQKL
jgi:gluconate 2-dehydrogenase gamma chain